MLRTGVNEDDDYGNVRRLVCRDLPLIAAVLYRNFMQCVAYRDCIGEKRPS
jgi:hypothetical protein